MEEYETVEETEVDSVDGDEDFEEVVVEVDADDGQVDWWGKDSAPSYW